MTTKTPIKSDKIEKFLKENPGWKVISPKNKKFFPAHDQLFREYKFPSDQTTNECAYSILQLSEKQNHHPLLVIEWRKISISWSTHEIKSIHQLDLEMAKKSDEIFSKLISQLI
jgi:4a-hydroxytetrahydrobiopterin dehydratase